MKFFLVLAVVLLGVWLWRAGRRIDAPPPKPPATPPSPSPQDMVSCALCAVHIPMADAVAGQQGLYCSVEHRQRAEP